MRETTAPDDPPGTDLVEVAFAGNLVEGEMIQGLLRTGSIASILQQTGINGPSLGIGLLPHSAQRVMVRAGQADAARRLLAEALAEQEEEFVNEAYLDDVQGRGPRSYGLIGAYARIWLWSLTALGIAFGVFLLARGT
ncbi:MAG TPA: DUF2007 domain-containing protein [Solirubrobacterales bacterium]|nr:DUF2007 domain-containing protein [Solirubrobacterales bacterium]